MSTNVEDSDGSVRVTRRSMRRMASTESLTDTDIRMDTPTVAPRNKKLNTISELAGTPKKSLIDSPRRTRKVSEEPVAVGSPFRRTTRASSQDKDVTASPLPTRASRRSALAESDTDDAASTPARAGKADRNKRKSTIASPKIAQIVEEPEDDNEKEPESVEADEATTLLDSSNDLELRTRSITKSPSVSLNGSLNTSKKSNGNLDSSHEEEQAVPMKVFTSRNSREAKTSLTEISFQDSDNEVPPAKSYSKAAHQSLVFQKTTFDGCLEKIANSGSKKRPLSESFAQELNAEPQKENGDTDPSDENTASSNNTSVRARRSIHDSESTSDDTPKMKAALEDLAKLRESFVAKKSPKSANKSPIAAEGTPVRAKTPQSAKKTRKTSVGESDEVTKLMEDFVDDNAEAVKTPKSAKKLANGTSPRDKTPKSAKKAADTPGKSPKRSNVTVIENQAMDITTNGHPNKTIYEPERMEIDDEVDADGDVRDMEVTLNQSGGTQKPSLQKSAEKHSIFSYIRKVSESSKRLSIKSLPNLASENEEEDSEAEVKVAKPRAKSWGISVTRSANDAIDISAKSESPIVVKQQDQRVKGYSSDEEDGEEEQSKNSFVDDEAEVGSEESITESEANYIREHEITDDGESIGSEDTDRPDDYDEDEDEGSSFLASENEDVDQYSMDSHEEEIEELKEKPKRKSRIIVPSSSEDDEPVVEKSKRTSITRAIPASSSENEEELVKIPSKSPKSASKKALMEPQQDNELQAVDSPVKLSQSARKSLKSPKAPVETEELVVEDDEAQKSKKMKRRRESDLDVSTASKPKRAKIGNTSVAETSGIAELFDEPTDKPVKQKKAKKSQEPESVDLEKVINKCDEYMTGYTAEKKAKMALKREKKAKKLAQKQKEAEAAKLAADSLDSSNNSNKENTIAPKKKNKSKIKKQKLVADMPEEKESLAEIVSKAQEKLERKRQRKLEKKLAKQQSAESENAEGVLEAPVSTKKSKKSVNAMEPESVPEPVVEKKKLKKNKVAETPEESAALEGSKKKNKKEIDAQEVKQSVAVPEKKKKKVVEEEPEPVQKGKKRKMDESIEETVAQPKKKLNVLKQIENPFQHQPQARTSRADDQDQLSIPLMSQKLKKVIPQKVEIEKKRKKKQPGGKKSIPEPRKSLPRPVFTTAGTFTEAPISPFKFESTTYVPIAKTASFPTSYGVVAFEAKKKKHAQQQQPAADFKTQAMYRNMKIRDGSSKNMAGLLRKQHSI